MSILAAYLARALDPTTPQGERSVTITEGDLGTYVRVSERVYPPTDDGELASVSTVVPTLDDPLAVPTLDRALDNLDRMIRRATRPRRTDARTATAQHPTERTPR